MKTLYEQSFSDDYSERKAIEAAHTAQVTVQKAKHRVQEILIDNKKSLPISVVF